MLSFSVPQKKKCYHFQIYQARLRLRASFEFSRPTPPHLKNAQISVWPQRPLPSLYKNPRQPLENQTTTFFLISKSRFDLSLEPLKNNLYFAERGRRKKAFFFLALISIIEPYFSGCEFKADTSLIGFIRRYVSQRYFLIFFGSQITGKSNVRISLPKMHVRVFLVMVIRVLFWV